MEVSPQLALQTDTRQLTLPRFLADVVERHGEAEAVRYEGLALTYGDVGELSLRLARGLAASGVRKGTHVAVLIANRPEWIIASYAVAMTGGVLIPVNTFATPDEREYILAHSDAEVLIFQAELLKRSFLKELLESYPELSSQEPGHIDIAALPDLHSAYCLDLEGDEGAIETIDRLDERAEPYPADAIRDVASAVLPEDEAMIIYTSGTTSRPKGVLHAHRAPVIQSWRFAELMGLDEDDRVWTAQPFFWTAGIAMSLGATFAAGGTLILQETFDAGSALACIEAERATTIFAWPHQEKAMAEHPDAAERELWRAKKVEFASPLAPLIGLKADTWGTYGSYGLSETFTLFSALPASAPAELRAGTNGEPLPGMSVRIVDPGGGGSLPIGESGEIAVKGLTFMLGYYKVDPELYLDAEGYFRTQDGGSIDEDGYLHWTGRLSNLIKTGGANVSPAEVDEVLVNYPGLRASVTLGIEHPTLGEAIVLCAVASGETEPALDALEAHLKTKLARYKVPRKILFFKEDEVSYTGNQKIQVQEMKAVALRRLEEDGVEIAGHRYG